MKESDNIDKLFQEELGKMEIKPNSAIKKAALSHIANANMGATRSILGLKSILIVLSILGAGLFFTYTLFQTPTTEIAKKEKRNLQIIKNSNHKNQIKDYDSLSLLKENSQNQANNNTIVFIKEKNTNNIISNAETNTIKKENSEINVIKKKVSGIQTKKKKVDVLKNNDKILQSKNKTSANGSYKTYSENIDTPTNTINSALNKEELNTLPNNHISSKPIVEKNSIIENANNNNMSKVAKTTNSLDNVASKNNNAAIEHLIDTVTNQQKLDLKQTNKDLITENKTIATPITKMNSSSQYFDYLSLNIGAKHLFSKNSSNTQLNYFENIESQETSSGLFLNLEYQKTSKKGLILNTGIQYDQYQYDQHTMSKNSFYSNGYWAYEFNDTVGVNPDSIFIEPYNIIENNKTSTVSRSLSIPIFFGFQNNLTEALTYQVKIGANLGYSNIIKTDNSNNTERYNIGLVNIGIKNEIIYSFNRWAVGASVNLHTPLKISDKIVYPKSSKFLFDIGVGVYYKLFKKKEVKQPTL